MESTGIAQNISQLCAHRNNLSHIALRRLCVLVTFDMRAAHLGQTQDMPTDRGLTGHSPVYYS